MYLYEIPINLSTSLGDVTTGIKLQVKRQTTFIHASSKYPLDTAAFQRLVHRIAFSSRDS
jgi:hypothetical protein